MSVLSFGHRYAAQLHTAIDNQFWKDLLVSWASCNEILKIDNIREILASSIWYNSTSISKLPILRPPFGLPKSGLISEVVLISNIIS